MSPNVSTSVETVKQYQIELGIQVTRIRLSRNLTQAQLADEAGTSVRTIKRLEGGEGGTLDSFIRVLMALRLDAGLLAFMPDPNVRPIERIKHKGQERQRASGGQPTGPTTEWVWGEDEE
ncbi:helix-turn-helix domain-containing protein [Asticcacaulis sp.]|uniref:helix-turn-helix domain-containing protein n=1 Tax=Asticcacaulis sp. TaxID=1872648 RepID=UPI002CA6E472|nr:helix-turn-helix domain-containing protein [Asticcacaulis sp.]HTM81521.1 helix-turn-helix domain-containing protein [Asticcacaulis sp.]